MAQHMQGPQPSRQQRRKQFPWVLWVVVSVVLIAIFVFTIATLLILQNQGISKGITILTPISIVVSIVIGLLGLLLAFLQWFHSKPSRLYDPSTLPPSQPQATRSTVHVPSSPLPLELSSPSNKFVHRGIVGLPPPTNPKTIQQREKVVKDIYTKLTQPDVTAIVLTGIGGVGKSTLAALVYRYVEEQRHVSNGLLQEETIWLTVNESVTMADLAGTLFEVLRKPLPDFSRLSPHSQAVMLFNALNTPDKVRLVILDQFENLLDWQTGHALADRPGVGEWLDAINSQSCTCRILLTSRPWPRGTREYPPTHMQEYHITGLELTEGIELLRKRGIEATDVELRIVVERCDGHAFALTLLASLLRNHNLDLSTMFRDQMYAQLWIGDIARNLLDYIYTKQLSEVQRKLLLAFAIYREPVSFNAVQALVDSNTEVPKEQILSSLQALRTQYLLQPSGEGRYQLHAIVADYAQRHFNESSEQANQQVLRATHAMAAEYYLQQAAANCPPREKRRRISDVHDLIEAIWQYCQAEHWQEAYDLMMQEGIFADLNRWGSNAILLELYQLLSLDKWHPEDVHRARIYIDLGEVYRVIGQNQQALRYLEQGLHICQQIGDRRGEGRALTYLGRVHNPLGNKQRAQAYYEQALMALREVGDRGGEGMVVNNLGYIHYDLGQMDRALEYYEQGLRIYQEAGDRRGEGTTLYSLGHVYDHLGLTDLSLRYYEQALSVQREVGDRGWEGITLSSLGSLYNIMGQKVRALNYCEDGLRISREVGDRAREGWALYQLGRVYQTLEEKDYALKIYEQALSILRETGDRRGEARALTRLGLMHGHLGEREQVWTYFREGLSILREVEDRWGEGETLYDLGEFCFEQNRYHVALACFLLARSIFEEVQSPYQAETQGYIERIQKEIGGEQFATLLANIRPQAHQIVEKTLGEEA